MASLSQDLQSKRNTKYLKKYLILNHNLDKKMYKNRA